MAREASFDPPAWARGFDPIDDLLNLIEKHIYSPPLPSEILRCLRGENCFRSVKKLKRERVKKGFFAGKES